MTLVLKLISVACVLLLLSSPLLSCKHVKLDTQSSQMNVKATRARLDRIVKRMLESNVMTDDDLSFAIRGLQHSDFMVRVEATEALELAARIGRMKKSTFIDLMVGQMVRTFRKEPLIYLLSCRSFLAIGVPSSAKGAITFEQISYAAELEGKLDRKERTSVGLALASPDPLVRVTAAYLIVSKRNLSTESRKWIESRVDYQVRTSIKEEREFWEIVKRVVEGRNPGK